jgi:alanyl-tRNA synthetase
MPSLNEIRSSFLSYFKNQGHSIQPSSPLVPRNDPTLMFVNSGMVQFKNLFTGIETRDYKCAATAQKCVRAGGKHNDLDNVGYTARHHTFFEMLGNFSFGDYFKNDAIPFAWEFITKELGIPKEKLVVTVYHDDEETISIWKKVSGLPDSSIIRISTDDNFWMMGATGPCGPCSEIFYDHGEDIWGGPPGSPEEDGDRFVEIWNLVFMQYEQLKDGTCINLPNQSIDTGLGLERVTALLQGTNDNYATDLMRNLIETSANLSNTEPDGSAKIHHRVISDHLRSTSFLIADGVLPSKDGRGYVLRRIMRRAMRHAHMLGTAEPLMYKLVPALVKEMGEAYPELYLAQDLIEETLRSEEARFKETLDRGLKLLDDEVLKIEEGTSLSGNTAFKLYDTFGFPLDLTQDALREKGLKVDVNAFNRAMTSQKEKARASWTGSGETTDAAIWFNISQEFGSTEFLGYGTEGSEAKVLAIVCEGKEVSNAKAGTGVQIVFNQSPFYAESGGQIGDSGQVELDGSVTQIEDVRLVAGVFVHFVDGLKFNLSVGDEVKLTVSSEKRSAIRSNHSATHLLNESLRKSLGNTVSQRGSLNSDDRLRFDFNYNKALSSEQINTIEKEVNMYIRQNSLVETRVMTPNEARDLGAQALFGEKYGEEVRVVSMGHASTGKGVDGQTYSIELCGGTHVKRTGDIGLFLILGESASSSGVRRIEAITGSTAVNYVRGRSNQLSLVEGLLKSKPEDLSARLKSLLNERKTLTSQVNDLRTAIATNEDNSNENIEKINGITFITKVTNGIESKNFPSIIDDYKSSTEMGIILLIGESSGKVSVAVGVTNDLLTKYSAVDLVKIAVSQLGGKGGGGRPDLAQGGAKEITGSENAINEVKKMIGV